MDFLALAVEAAVRNSIHLFVPNGIGTMVVTYKFYPAFEDYPWSAFVEVAVAR